MNEDELAALCVALDLLKPVNTEESLPARPSRWKLAARMPELDMDDLRALH
jgi:hypothetical protein